MKPVELVCYSDILCVWAYISEYRLKHLRETMGDRVAMSCRYFSVFGDTGRKFGAGWKDRGGFEGYADHVQQVVGRFPEVKLDARAWRSTRPASSAPAHLMLKAVSLAERAGDAPSGAADALAGSLRCAFFQEGLDIGRLPVLRELVAAAGLSLSAIEPQIESGAAFAAVAADQQGADAAKINGSPSFVLNEGRQTLYGNVGYHIIEANILELMREPHAGEASWC